MTNKEQIALRMVEEALAKYTEIPATGIHLDTKLADIQIDSLTLAELLFELEDRVGKTISDTQQIPIEVRELVDLITPHLDDM